MGGVSAKGTAGTSWLASCACFQSPMRVTRDIGKGMAARPSATLAEATLGDAAAMAASNMVDMGAEARTFFARSFLENGKRGITDTVSGGARSLAGGEGERLSHRRERREHVLVGEHLVELAVVEHRLRQHGACELEAQPLIETHEASAALVEVV